MVSGVILSAYVAIGSPQGDVLPPEDALRYAAKAGAIYMKLDKRLSRWEKKHLGLAEHKELLYGGAMLRIMIERRASYTWVF
jgi:hypothetical protein